MFRKRLHPILIIPVILVLRASGTTVVVYRSPTQIVVAADTLLLVSKGTGFERRRMCKIRSSRGLYFAAAGLTKNSRAGYSVVSLAERACAQSRNVIDAAKRFEFFSLKPFETIARRYQRKSPEFYRVQIKEKPEPLQVVFMGIDRGVPTFALVTFTTSETKGLVSVTPHVKVCPGVQCPTGETVTILGENVNADRATHEPSFFREVRHDPQSMLHRLVQIEATADPSRVAAPFDILTISTTGSEWNEQGYCK
jgi:hypothetical protein